MQEKEKRDTDELLNKYAVVFALGILVLLITMSSILVNVFGHANI